MRSGTTRYPVDRYLDKSSQKFEMVNIIDDDIWNPEPALRPEDEIILRKLHEMLQSTADDLKLLSGELAKYHEPGVVYKTPQTPFDDEFNDKVHIEEIVNAKFHGLKIVNPPKNISVGNLKNDTDNNSKYNMSKHKPLNTDVEVAPVVTKKPTAVNRNLGVSRTRIMEINNTQSTTKEENIKTAKLNNGKVLNNAPAVGYNEFNFTYVKSKVSPRKVLQVQDMPSINIRSELKRQNVLQLDILPGNNDKVDENTVKTNVSVIALRHRTETKTTPPKKDTQIHSKDSFSNTIRKISKMSTCESSGSTNNISSDSKVKLDVQKRIFTSIRNSPKNSARSRSKKNIITKNELEQRHRSNLEEWKRKLNVVYGPSTSKKTMKTAKSKSSPRKLLTFNNTEYIPYSKLTVGGARASDIEKEISNLPNKNELPLSPILDKIFSRENSFHQDSPRNLKNTPRILTTSDENLLQEVIDIEKTVSDTLSRNKKQRLKKPEVKTDDISSDEVNDDEEGKDSYADDFEDEKSDHSEKSGNKAKSSNGSETENSHDADSDSSIETDPIDNNVTYVKTSNLSFKDSVDIFEFIHSVDTQDNATQSNVPHKISPKETQTSPRNDKPSTFIQPIHNDLWPSIDPKQEVEKMFELEKDFIKKLILDEYGDLLEKNITKPSTSNTHKSTYDETRKNITAVQKNTQTSPAHVKSVMTSPKRTKTRTTSPFHLTLPVNKNTSPMIFVTNEENLNVEIKSDADDISVNLSSPRFSLRLPQSSREVLSNITTNSRNSPSPSKISLKVDKLNKIFRKTTVSSSSSVDADNSSSELSSLGEIKIKRRLKKNISSLSESSSTSTLSKYSYDPQSVGLLPLRSEGEVSLTQVTRKTGKSRQSEGETSFGPK